MRKKANRSNCIRTTPSRLATAVTTLLAVLALVLSVAGAALAVDSGSALKPGVHGLTVTYLSASAVYLDGGRQEGLAPGARLAVKRAGETIAELEVLYVAEHSSSCRVASSRQAIRQGDAAVVLSLPAAAESAPPPESTTVAPPPSVASAPARSSASASSRRPRVTRASGSFSLGFQSLRDSGPAGQGFDEGTGRLSLRLRDLGGTPLEMRLRLRGRSLSRRGFGSSTSEDSTRLYELSVTYAPAGGRFAWQAGRLGASPFVGIGYLDGALGQVRLTRRFHLGAFAGSRPEVVELGLKSAGTKYGAFARYATAADEGPGYAEVVLAGIGEYAKAGEVSREYVSLESRFGSGTRWSLFARAELDLNRDWRKEISGRSSQISNASVSGSVRFARSWRWSLTYDQRRNYLTFETKPRPEDVFRDILREGVRSAIEWQGRGGFNASLGVGMERQQSGDDPTTSATLSVYHTNLFGWSLLGGGDFTFYSGGVAEGYVGSLRARRYFRGGHDLGLTIGASQTELAAFGEPRQNQWARLSGTLELPYRIYLMGEVEYSTGDDFEGTRYFLEVGRRF